MTAYTRQTNRIESRIAASRSDFREARHYCPDAADRARKTAKREAKRAVRRLPIDMSDVDAVSDVAEAAPETGDMVILIDTQYAENYGEPGADYWKYKGGDTVVVTSFRAALDANIGAKAAAVVAALRGQIEHSDGWSRTYILDWQIVFGAADVLTDDERCQLRFDGRISFPSPRLAAA